MSPEEHGAAIEAALVELGKACHASEPRMMFLGIMVPAVKPLSTDFIKLVTSEPVSTAQLLLELMRRGEIQIAGINKRTKF